MPIAIKEENLFLSSLKNTGAFIKFHRKMLLIISLILTLLFGGMSVFAVEYEERPDSWDEVAGIDSVTFGFLDEMFSNSEIEDVAKLVQVSFGSDGSFSVAGYESLDSASAASAIVTANNLCKGLAMVFLIITFFIGLLTLRERDQMGEEFIRRLVMLIFGMVLIYYAMTWSFTLANMGSNLANKIAGAATSADNSGALETMKGTIWDNTHIKPEGTHIWDKLGQLFNNGLASVSYLIQMFIPYLAMKTARIFTNFAVWGRAIEIIALAAISPLAFMEVPDSHNPLAGSGMRYLKNMIALSLSGAVIVLVLIITNSIITGIVSNMGTEMNEMMDGIWQVVLIALVQAGIVNKSQQIAKTAVGVG